MPARFGTSGRSSASAPSRPSAVTFSTFPEIFPTRLRTTGTGLCYNVARYLAATGPLILGALTRALDGKFEMSGFRAAALLVSFCYLIGIIALIWAPETMGRGLPEDEDQHWVPTG